jgi:NADPH-ferrihemoprotein reductase
LEITYDLKGTGLTY